MFDTADLFALTDDVTHPTGAPPRTLPGKVPVTARLAPRPIVFRFAEGPRPADASAAADLPSGGDALPVELRARFEQSLGTDLGGVRVHTGGASAQAARQLQAKAFAVGDDIHFGAGQFRPSDPFGVHLIAHEVAHTVQQRGGSGVQAKAEVSEPGDALELEADRAADAMVAGDPAMLSSGGPAIARVKDLDDAAARGGKEYDENAKGAPANLVSNVGDRNGAAALLSTIEGYSAEIRNGVATGQVTQEVMITNQAVAIALKSYIEDAEQQTSQLGAFQGMFQRVMSDFGRLNEMSKSFDGFSLAGMKDKDAAEKHGEDQAKEIFNGEDAKRLKALAAKIDPTINDRLDHVETVKQGLVTKGQEAVAAGDALTGALALVSNRRRELGAKADGVTSPKLQAEAARIREAARTDITGKAGNIIKDAIVGGVGGAKGGAAGAAAGAVKGGGKSIYDNIIKPQLDVALEKANIEVGVFPKRDADADKVQADMAAWSEMLRLRDLINQAGDQSRQMGKNIDTKIAAYNQAREGYEKEMIAIGKAMDRAIRASQQPKQECGCPPPDPKKAPPDKGPRFETAMQFLAEADRFLAQSEVTRKQGEDELVVAKGKSVDNATNRAHDKIKNINAHTDVPSQYYYLSRFTVKQPDGTEVPRVTAHPQSFEIATGANPRPSVPGEPDEAHAYGSAEGTEGYGANQVIADQLTRLQDSHDKIQAYRSKLAGAIGL